MSLSSGWAPLPGYLEVTPPKFATLRDPEAPTLGTRQALFADVWLRKPLLPHQRYVCDVAGELNPDGTPRRKLVVVTFQRQGGKSHMCMTKNGERCMSCRNYRAFYTAQTGGDAQDQFLKFADEVVTGTPLDKIVKVRRGNGKADMTFPTGSTLRPRPPTEGTGHGNQSDSYDIDEGWAFSEDEGKAIMQAIAPTQLTRPNAQIWVWSAGGTAASTWLAALVARGRAGDDSIAYFEWGVPDELDMDDLPAVLDYHPARNTLITVDSLRDLQTKLDDPAEFARAAGNRWTEVIGGSIPWTLWESRRWADPIPDTAPVGFGAARAADGEHVAIAAAAEVDGQLVGEIIDVVPVFGAGAAIKHYAAGEALAVDPTGPSASLHDELGRLKVPLLAVSGRDASAATSTLLDGLRSGAVRVRRHDALDAAVRVAGTRRVGDGGLAWARVAAGASIAALDALTSAVWAVQHRPRKVAKPSSTFGSAA